MIIKSCLTSVDVLNELAWILDHWLNVKPIELSRVWDACNIVCPFLNTAFQVRYKRVDVFKLSRVRKDESYLWFIEVIKELV